jgi:hypothetical protein
MKGYRHERAIKANRGGQAGGSQLSDTETVDLSGKDSIGLTDTRAQNITGSIIHVFNPALVNELRIWVAAMRSSGTSRFSIN